MAQVDLHKLTKSYSKVEVIHGVDLRVDDGEFVVFVGPSGCGKSTLLRMIAGLEEITKGDLIISGRRANDETPTQRGVSMVFQNYALYPHMTVAQNIGFGLKMSGDTKAQIKEKVAAASSTLRLDDYLGRKPAALSGGQRQRVAIGRAIVRNPEVFLFDEPLSNLDAELRVSMRLEIARLHRELDTTMIYVTHDQTEAMTLADRIVVLNAGRIEQVGTPQELYEQPANLFVAGFIGSPAMNLVALENAPKSLASEMKRCGASTIGVRPEHLSVGAGRSDTEMTVEAVEYLGGTRFVYGTMQGGSLIAELREGDSPRIDDVMPLQLHLEQAHFFDAQGHRINIA